MKRAIPGLIASLVVIGFLATLGWASSLPPNKQSSPLSVKTERQSVAPLHVGPGTDLITVEGKLYLASVYVNAVQKAQYDEAVATQAKILEYVSDIQAAEQADAARIAEEQQVRSSQPQLPAAPMETSHGGHSDAWWHGVANCEQGGRNDPYFGYFSFMDGSAAGKSWDEQVAMGNSVLASVSSESPAWAPSCVAAGYAASPGG